MGSQRVRHNCDWTELNWMLKCHDVCVCVSVFCLWSCGHSFLISLCIYKYLVYLFLLLSSNFLLKFICVTSYFNVKVQLWLLFQYPLTSQWLSGNEPVCQCSRCSFDSWIRKIPWRGKQYSCLVNLMAQRSLVGNSSFDCSLDSNCQTWLNN